MKKISVVIIAKDAQDIIVDALETVQFCDEILVIDDNSKDNTKEIAEKYGARVVEFSSDSFAKLRNEGLKKAESEWILYIDADERVSVELKEAIESAVEKSQKQAYRIKRKNFYLGSNPWPYIEKLERLFKKNTLKGWYGDLHESPQIEGAIGDLDGFLYHYTHRSLSQMLEKTIEWSEIEAKLRFDAGHPRITWWRFPRVMIKAFFNSYITQGGWKAGVIGIIESLYQMFSIFITYARLWEMQQKNHDINANH